MRPRLLVLFAIIVLLPVGLLLWLGRQVQQNEARALRIQVQELYAAGLRETAATIARYLEQREREFLQLTDLKEIDPVHLRRAIRQQPTIRQMFVLSAAGELLHPAADRTLNEGERDFLLRAGPLLMDKELVYAVRSTGHQKEDRPVAENLHSVLKRSDSFNQRELPQAGSQSELEASIDSGSVAAQQGSTVQTRHNAQTSASTKSYGWYVWFWGKGLNLIFWQKLADGNIVGAELERMRLIGDIVGLLPATTDNVTDTQTRTRLLDGSGSVLYQWGSRQPEQGEEPFVSAALEYPLHSWRLEQFTGRVLLEDVYGRSKKFGLLALLMLVTVTMIGMAIYLYREYTRDLREATRRVNFVNQVSHELKTPLTNIRMYAELLERDLEVLGDAADARLLEYVGILVNESQRLSRLIANVLTFAKGQKNRLKLRLQPLVPDECIRAIVERFQPALTEKRIETTLKLDAAHHVLLDGDACEQILNNLIGNVEKYAAKGGRLSIASRQDLQQSLTAITIADAGDGIPESLREKIFLPFFRGSDEINEGVTGTGIGLSIARDLARMHGGDVVLLPSRVGACFEVRLQTRFENK